MKDAIMAKVLGWVFDKVMKKPLARFEQAVNRPFATQEDALRRILNANALSEFGRTHNFAAMADLPGTDLWKAYRRDVPIRNYNDFLPQIERMKQGEENVLMPGKPDMFSLTSGTTSEPKFCPVNRAFIREHHRQHLIWMYHVYASHPRVNQGKYLVMASPAEIGRTAGGIPYGAMSGKQLDTQSIPVRRRMAVPAAVRHLADAEDRWFNLLLFALAEENLRVVTSVNPSTLVAMAGRMSRDADRLIEHLAHGHPAKGKRGASPRERALAAAFRPNPARARRLREIVAVDGSLTPSAAWPELSMLLTWQGGASSFYLPLVAALWGNTPMRCLGLRASEGTFSIPLRDGDASGVLAVGGHVMEFVPADVDDPRGKPTLLAGQLQEGGLYRLIITTSGGFYRYDMGDLVRVTGFKRRTPLVAFERRAGAVLSATGEKLTEDQVVAAMESAAASGPLMNGFSLTFEVEGGVVRYVLALECIGAGEGLTGSRGKIFRDRLRQLLVVFDDELMGRNVEYRGKREDGRIGAPRAVLLEPGCYERWRGRRAAEGRPESQVKLPILVRPSGVGRVPVAGCEFFDGARIIAEVD